ncbi:MAG: hypothetical protein AMK72_05190, partial [Planctomycetes bacterium SM23_25]
GDVPLERAYKLIKAISKRKRDVIEAEQEAFLAGCKRHRLGGSLSGQIWELITHFGGYGFNKSHSARYAQIAYQTAYLKAHYPVEFMAALLTFEMVNSDKLAEYMDECRRMNIEVAPPDVNESGADFTVVGDRVRFGLAAVKGVGERAVEAITQARDAVGRFDSLFHFCEHVDLAAVNRAVVESLIKCGAFDSTGARKSQLAAVLDKALGAGAQTQDDSRKGQMNFFDAFAEDAPPDDVALPDVPEWTEEKLSKCEKESLGLYVKHHPLGQYEKRLRHFVTAFSSDLGQMADRAEAVLGGLIKSVRTIITKTGKNVGAKMAVFDVEDLAGTLSCVIFPPDYEQFAEVIQPDRIVFVRGQVDRQREEPQIRTSEVFDVADGPGRLSSAVVVRLGADGLDDAMLTALRDVLAAHPGPLPVFLQLESAGNGKTLIRAGDSLKVAMDTALQRDLENLLGDGHTVLATNGTGIMVEL